MFEHLSSSQLFWEIVEVIFGTCDLVGRYRVTLRVELIGFIPCGSAQVSWVLLWSGNHCINHSDTDLGQIGMAY